jgi:hypothetical protein
MLDLLKLQQEVAAAAEAKSMQLKSSYLVFVVGNLSRDSSHQYGLPAFLDTTKSEAEIAAEIIEQARTITEADSTAAIEEENAALRRKLAVVEARERSAALLANHKEPPPIP